MNASFVHLLVLAALPVMAPLPDANGIVEIAAQEWPQAPGPRTINVYIHYPDGSADRVGPGTGLMLDLHNWGGTGTRGTADPDQLAKRYNVVAIGVDYLQSGPGTPEDPPYDFGYLQALDALRALYYVWDGLDNAGRPFARGRIYATGGSGGGNVTLMVNKFAPRTFACAIDMCGMAKLSDDIAYGIPGRTGLSARYSTDPASDRYLTPDAQAIRFVGHPEHARTMAALGNAAKLIVVHGTTDASCPVDDAREMAANLRAAGLDVEPHFVTEADLDGKALKTTGHSLGDRTQIVFRFGDAYLLPGSPKAMVRQGKSDFEHRDETVVYPTPGGRFVISYKDGYPVGRFEPTP